MSIWNVCTVDSGHFIIDCNKSMNFGVFLLAEGKKKCHFAPNCSAKLTIGRCQMVQIRHIVQGTRYTLMMMMMMVWYMWRMIHGSNNDMWQKGTLQTDKQIIIYVRVRVYTLRRMELVTWNGVGQIVAIVAHDESAN